ncbi:acyl-CoA binding domain-containing protein 6 [Podochytrium sp. JEL0797]|nr:acyl-CoA binding domain-containing protein 6 [Podochytrium sp. JEL0797]
MSFETASAFVASNSAVFTNQTLLELYGLYKLATVGPCNTPSPGLFAFQARAKWDAWNSLGSSVSPDEAKLRYTAIVEPKMGSDSTTAETYEREDESDESLGVAVSCMRRDEELVEVKKDGEKTLFDWVQDGNLADVEAFLAANPHVDLGEKRIKDGVTPLHWACDREMVDIVKLLIGRKADLNARDNDGMTPLHYAALTENREIFSLLKEGGADASIADDSGDLPTL